MFFFCSLYLWTARIMTPETHRWEEKNLFRFKTELNSPCVSLNLSEVCSLKQGCLHEASAQQPDSICIYYRTGKHRHQCT